jgi:hypothetical protein
MLKFLGIGAQKAGTTWLYEQLRKHPDIGFPAGKEIHFWDAQRERGLDWYRGLFQSRDLVEGEITPAYAFQADVTVAEIASAFPDLRLIYIMRNPIDRAWSSALMALRRSEMEIDEASFGWFRDHFNSRGSLARGDYERCIRTWRRHYPATSLLLLFFEEIVKNPRKVLQLCATHIGIDPSPFQGTPEEALKQRVHEGSGKKMPEDVRELLLTLYEPRIRSLQSYLGCDLNHWLS